MKLFNSGKNRKSIRLKGHDYSNDGFYFVTVCCVKNIHFFGEVVEERMMLNSIGQIAYDEWLRTCEIRKYVILHEFIVMPNHIHMIIELKFQKEESQMTIVQPSSRTIGSIVRGYKIAVIKRIKQEVDALIQSSNKDKIPYSIMEEYAYRIWHRNYYEYIIRDARAYANISKYIRENPKKWK